MINFREINNHFYLSGRWENFLVDVATLQAYNIKYVLDVQYTSVDFSIYNHFLASEILKEEGIEYEALPMYDSDEFYSVLDLEAALDNSYEALDRFVSMTKKRENILIKSASGISRAPTVYIFYRCYRTGRSFDEVYEDLLEYDDGEFPSSINPFFYDYLSSRFNPRTSI